MKFKISKSILLEGLQSVQNVAMLRSTIPILSNVLITAQEQLVLTTTDIDVSVCCYLDADIIKTGSTTLPVRRLSSIVREFPDSDINIDVSDKNIATINCNSSVFKVIGLSEDEFPPISQPEGECSYHMDQGLFKDMLKKTFYAVSTDETRHVLNGISLNFKDGKLVMVATDGRRLALVENEVEFPKEIESELILPIKVVTELLHILADEGSLKIYVNKNKVAFDLGKALVTSKLIEGTYPNYKQVIPAQCEERITVERETLLTALKRVSLMATDNSNATKLTFEKNKIIISLNTPEVGEAKETIPIKYSGKEISVAFNPEFMIDPLKNLKNDEIFIELTDELSPGVIKCDTPFLYVLMPIRIDSNNT